MYRPRKTCHGGYVAMLGAEERPAVAYQERFDELAKGLATNRLSRGQVLKTIAATLLMGIFPAFGGESAEAAGCRAVGKKCSRANQCCTGICSKGGKCACKNTGSCKSGKVCCTGTCKNGKCVCKKPNETCTHERECCGLGSCVNGRCECDPSVSTPCASACCNPLIQECCNGKCVNKCPAGERLNSDCLCQKCKLEGQSCLSDDECCATGALSICTSTSGGICIDCSQQPNEGNFVCAGSSGRKLCCSNEFPFCCERPNTGDPYCCPHNTLGCDGKGGCVK